MRGDKETVLRVPSFSRFMRVIRVVLMLHCSRLVDDIVASVSLEQRVIHCKVTFVVAADHGKAVE